MGISENTPRLLPVRTEAELPVRIFDERHWQSQPELQQSRATGAFRRQRSKQGEIGGGFKFGAEVGDGSESKRRRIDSRGTVHMVEEEAHRKDMRGGFAACVTRFAKGFVNPDG